MAEKLKDAMDGMGTSILRTRSSSVPLPSCNTVAFGALYRVCKIHYYSLYALHSLNVASLEFMFSCVLSLRQYLFTYFLYKPDPLQTPICWALECHSIGESILNYMHYSCFTLYMSYILDTNNKTCDFFPDSCLSQNKMYISEITCTCLLTKCACIKSVKSLLKSAEFHIIV